MQSPERHSRQQARSSSKTTRKQNDIKAVIQTNKSVDGEQSVDGQRSCSSKGLQAEASQTCGSEHQAYNEMLSEKARNQQLINEMVEQLVQTKKLNEKLEQIKKRQEDNSQNAAKRSLLPFCAQHSAGEANSSARASGGSQRRPGLKAKLRTQQQARTLDGPNSNWP